MTEGHRIVVIEDDPQMRRFLKTGLDAHGYQVVEAETARAGLAAVVTANPDLIILDLTLPDLDGFAVVQEVRGWSQTPIIILTSRNAVNDKIAALDAGANDYVTKPFDMAELLARMRAALRHRIRQEGGQPAVVSGSVSVDMVRREVRRGSEPVKLSPREYEVLRVLAQNADMVVTHQMLLREVWGPAHVGDTNYLRIFIGRLRQKLEDDPARPRTIVTESGVGYRFRLRQPAAV